MRRLRFEECKNCKEWNGNITHCANICHKPLETFEEFNRYKDLEEQGLLSKFHLGDEFWVEWVGEILKAKIVMLQQKKDGTWKYRFCDEKSHTFDYKEKHYGKYFFDTKAEAEEVLKKKQEK